MAGGSRKGFPFERKVCKILSLWWSYGENEHIFWRTEGSGGRATNVGQELKYSYGDVGFKEPAGKPLIDYFLIECKRGYTNEIDPLAIVDSKKKTVLVRDWIVKAEEERTMAGREEILIIFQRDRHEICAIARGDSEILPYPFIYPENFLKIGIASKADYIVLSLETYLSITTPEEVKNCLSYQ